MTTIAPQREAGRRTQGRALATGPEAAIPDQPSAHSTASSRASVAPRARGPRGTTPPPGAEGRQRGRWRPGRSGRTPSPRPTQARSEAPPQSRISPNAATGPREARVGARASDGKVRREDSAHRRNSSGSCTASQPSRTKTQEERVEEHGAPEQDAEAAPRAPVASAARPTPQMADEHVRLHDTPGSAAAQLAADRSAGGPALTAHGAAVTVDGGDRRSRPAGLPALDPTRPRRGASRI